MRRKILVAAAAAAAMVLAACSSTADNSTSQTSSESSSNAPAESGSSPSEAPAGESSSSEEPTSEAAPQTLVVQTTSYLDALLKAAGDALIAQNPGLTITYQEVSAEQETSTNLQVVTSSDAPDIADVPINGNVYPQLIKADQLVPLDDVWATAGLDAAYGESVAGSLKVNNVPHVVNVTRVLYGMAWYNKDVFGDLGIELPAPHSIPTMDALKTITASLRGGGYQPLLIPGGGEEYWSWLVDVFLPTSATPDAYTNYLTSFSPAVDVTAKYSDPEFTAVFDRLKTMYDDQMFQDGILGMNNASTQALFASGKAGMIMGHALTPSALEKLAGAPMNLDWLLLPPMHDGEKTLPIVYNGNTFGIPTNAKNPAMAKKFLEVLMSADIQSKVNELTAGGTPGTNLPNSNDPTGILQYTAENGQYVGWSAVTPGDLNQVDSKVQAVLTGKQTSEQAGQELDAVLEKIRSGSN